MVRMVAAIIFGYVTIALMVIITGQIASAIVPGFQAMNTPPAYYFNLVINTLYSLVGGYLCSTVARDNSRSATIGLIVLGEVIGIMAQIRLWHTVPHWFGIGLLALYAAGVWIGGTLRSHGKQSRPPMAV